MRILGIETSCDDTCVAVIEATDGLRQPRFRARSNVVSSQVKMHAPFGGVVPTLAAREHARNIAPVLRKALRDARCKMQNVDLITVTTHPGLLPALVVGVHAARALAWAHRKPIIGVNHLAGHAASILLPYERISKKRDTRLRQGIGERAGNKQIPNTKFQTPAVGIIASGGHTQLVLVRELGTMRVIGETRDDAAGEAFDKIARLLGLPYPGGPAIASEAARYKDKLRDTSYKPFGLPRPMIHSDDFDFSFSGLKTAVLYLIRDLERQRSPLPVAALCVEVQQVIVDVLIAKTIRAAKGYGAETVFLSGGVANNRELRKQLAEAVKDRLPSSAFSLPAYAYTPDNAAMIAAAGYLDWQRMTPTRRRTATWRRVRARA